MSVYVYGGSPQEKRPHVVAETRREWQAYERDNRRANDRYETDRDTIDQRYDPHGGKTR